MCLFKKKTSSKFTKLLPNLKNIYYYLLLIFIIILNLDSALVYDSNIVFLICCTFPFLYWDAFYSSQVSFTCPKC